MAQTLRNQLTWSYSRKSTFDSCRRRYYYKYYLSWGGWDAEAPEERRLAYRLGKMTSMAAYSGSLVHDIIAKLVDCLGSRRPLPGIDQCLEEAWQRWQRALQDSKSDKWIKNPKHCVCFMEDYYRDLHRDSKAEAAWLRISLCLTNFWHCDAWEKLQKAPPSRWLATDTDGFRTVPVDGIHIFARPDFSYDASPRDAPRSRCLIFDWKTGKEKKADQEQAYYYALFAQDVWGFAADTAKVKIVYLYPETWEQDIKITVDGLDDAKGVMRASHQEMCALVTDLEDNLPLAMPSFPVTLSASNCAFCEFRELCRERPILASLS